GRKGARRSCRPDFDPYQEYDRHYRQGEGGRPGNAGTLARQGEAALRQAAEGLILMVRRREAPSSGRCITSPREPCRPGCVPAFILRDAASRLLRMREGRLSCGG